MREVVRWPHRSAQASSSNKRFLQLGPLVCGMLGSQGKVGRRLSWNADTRSHTEGVGGWIRRKLSHDWESSRLN